MSDQPTREQIITKLGQEMVNLLDAAGLKEIGYDVPSNRYVLVFKQQATVNTVKDAIISGLQDDDVNPHSLFTFAESNQQDRQGNMQIDASLIESGGKYQYVLSGALKCNKSVNSDRIIHAPHGQKWVDGISQSVGNNNQVDSRH